MQQQNIISSSCKATPTNSFPHLLQNTISFKLISLISLIVLSVLVEAAPILPALTVPDLRSFANYAAATYCKVPLENWDCGEVCQANAGTKVVKVFNNDVLNTRGYIATDQEKQLIVVSYRGTVPGSFKNYFTDIIFYHDGYPAASRDARVHHGFLNAFEQIQPQVTDDVVKLHQENPDFRIGFMGHSLGGALATFSALDLVQKVPELANNDKLFLATFGQPRVGNKEFAEYVENNVKSVRTIVRGDPIPRLPPSWPIPFFGSYKHFGEELYIDNPDQNPESFKECNAEDPQCSESVSVFDLKFKYHSGPYYGVNMRDCNPPDQTGTDSVGIGIDDESYNDEGFNYTTDPYFNFDPNYDYEQSLGAFNGTNSTGISNTAGGNGTNSTEISGTVGDNGTTNNTTGTYDAGVSAGDKSTKSTAGIYDAGDSGTNSTTGIYDAGVNAGDNGTKGVNGTKVAGGDGN